MSTLPKLSVPKYRLNIPSTGETVQYRPYLVREEKILLIAAESEDSDQIEKAIISICNDCLEYDKDVADLTTYDLEYIFLQIRGKSVGAKIEIYRGCEECNKQNTVIVNLDHIEVKNDEEKESVVKLADDLSFELKHPTIKERISFGENDSDTEVLITSAANALNIVYYGDETFEARDASIDERKNFIEGLSTEQFQKIVDYLLDVPYVAYEGKFTCRKCGCKNEFEYTGLIDFFI